MARSKSIDFSKDARASAQTTSQAIRDPSLIARRRAAAEAGSYCDRLNTSSSTLESTALRTRVIQFRIPRFTTQLIDEGVDIHRRQYPGDRCYGILQTGLSPDQEAVAALELENLAASNTQTVAQFLRNGDLPFLRNYCLHTMIVGIPT